jgi:hypothetical protein
VDAPPHRHLSVVDEQVVVPVSPLYLELEGLPDGEALGAHLYQERTGNFGPIRGFYEEDPLIPYLG